MKPFILNYAESADIDSADVDIEYSSNLNLSVVKGTTDAAINLATASLKSFTKAGEEPTDYSGYLSGRTHTREQMESIDLSKKSKISCLAGETHTLVAKESTDFNTSLARIAKRMSLESLTEARESTDIK